MTVPSAIWGDQLLDVSEGTETRKREQSGRAESDIVMLGIAVAALLLFITTGGTVAPKAIARLIGQSDGPENLLVTALLLNIALIIFGWRRYTELSAEIQVRREAEEQARLLAETDPLTGCFNRRTIEPEMRNLIARTEAEGIGMAALMLDLDNFKHINDLHGHRVGDQVLLETSRRLREALPRDALLGRLGGDEFVIVLPFEPGAPERIDDLAGKLVTQVAQPIEHEGLFVDLTVSIGIAWGAHGCSDIVSCSADNLLHRADIAMYHAKNRGRNRHCWFDLSMENELRFRNELETGIRRGVRRGEFVPFYEQQIDLETGKLMGFEMLARWQSPQFGLVGPEIFIPIAEEIGAISEMSDMLIAQALEDAKQWNPELTLSVNISPVQLRDPWFAQKIMRMLARSNFPPHRLDIEITESCLHENIGVVRSVVTSLKNQGIRISLDDFGTGYASLAQLRSLPFDRIKIDRSFVSEIAEEGTSSKLLEAIISLGRGLDLPITAEGVESNAVLKALQQMGHMKGQGYLYGRPEDAEATYRRLSEARLLARETEPNLHLAPLDAESARKMAG